MLFVVDAYRVYFLSILHHCEKAQDLLFWAEPKVKYGYKPVFVQRLSQM